MSLRCGEKSRVTRGRGERRKRAARDQKSPQTMAREMMSKPRVGPRPSLRASVRGDADPCCGARDLRGGQEFAAPDWEANDEDAEDEKLWEDDWDDDDADDEFVVQLREELAKTGGSS